MTQPGSSSAQYSAPTVDASTIYTTETQGGAAATPAPAPSGSGGSSGGSGAPAAGPTFQVDVDGVRSVASRIAADGDQAASILNGLRSQLLAAGEPWGTDDLGKSFGHAYTAQVNQGFAAMASLGDALAGIANGLASQADAYQNTDQAVADTLNNVTSTLQSANGPGGQSA